MSTSPSNLSSLENQLTNTAQNAQSTVPAIVPAGDIQPSSILQTGQAVLNAASSAKSAAFSALSFLTEPIAQQVAIGLGFVMVIAAIFSFRGPREFVLKASKKAGETTAELA